MTSGARFTHIPVLLKEVLEYLKPKSEGHYLDGTLGLGGHAKAILTKAPNSRICGLDRDLQALDIARENLREYGSRVHYFQMPFGEFPNALRQLGWQGIDGAILDLGVSSLQLDDNSRGFSFSGDGPLDMRMDTNSGSKSAWHLVNQGNFKELRDIIALYGEEPQAAKIAKAIIDNRQKESIDTTSQLASIVINAYPPAWRRKARRNPATRTFQALRMAVNDEVGQLKVFLEHIMDWLSPGASLVIISFHSLEDRLVKQSFINWSKDCICAPHIAICDCGHKAEVKILTKKPLMASPSEIDCNPRASSAKLRALEKI